MSLTVRHISSYTLSTAVTAITGFLSVPLLLRLLGQAEFGRWALVEPVLLVGAQVALMGVNWGVIKLVSHDRLGAHFAYLKIVKSGWTLLVLFALISAVTLGAMGFSLHDSVYLCVVVFIDALLLLIVATLRASESSSAFAGTQVLRGLTLITILVAAVYGIFRISEVGSVLQARLATGIVSLSLGAWLVDQIRASTEQRVGRENMIAEKDVYRNAVRYGLPMLATALLTMILDFASRYLLAAHLDLALLGQYVIYTKLVSALSLLVVTPFSLWWATERFRRLREVDGGRRYFPLVASAFLIVLLAGAGSLWLVSRPLLELFAPGVPYDPSVTALLLLGAVFAGMAYPLNIGLLNEGKTHKNIYAVLIGATVHLILCIVLIPPFGMLGAASATMLGFFVYMAAFALLSQKTYFVPFAYGKMFLTAAIVAVALLVIAYTIPGGDLAGLVTRVLVFLSVLGFVGRPVYTGFARYNSDHP